MTQLGEMAGLGRTNIRPAEQSRSTQQSHPQAEQPEINVASGERAVSVAAGAILALLGIGRRSIPGAVIAAVGGGLIYRGATGHCSAYSALGMNTANDQGSQSTEEDIAQHGIHVEQAFLIGRPAEDLYRFWRDFSNLPRIMTHLHEVRIIDEKRSHWVADAPRIAGGKVEWDAEITSDEPNSRIAWKSLAGSDIDCAGEIRFSKALGDRGTEVHVFMNYVPPAGRLGHWIATMFGEAPRRQMRDDLRNFKRLMECGEILTINGQPRGTCTGKGKRDHSQ